MNAANKVIATDLDGTLFFPKRRIRMLTKSNTKFIRSFIDSGGRLVIVSGRNELFTDKVVKKIDRKVDIIGCNSSYIRVDGKLIKDFPMDNKKTTKLIEEIKKEYKPTGVFLMTKDYSMIVPKKEFWWFHRFGYGIYQKLEGTYKEKSVCSDEILHEQLKSGIIYKVMLFFGITHKSKLNCMEVNRALREKYKDYEFSWCGQLIEVSNKGCSKAEGIKEYLKYIKVPEDNVMVVGDSGNDISMFKEFKNSFCMRHGAVRVARYASHVISRVSELENYIDKKGEEK